MTAPRRFDYLDGIRGVAILCVVQFHWGLHYLPIGGGGYLGVDLFFVLSGFVITTLLWQAVPKSNASLAAAWARFIVRRARRLYPALLGLVVGGTLLYLLLPWTQLSPSVVVRRAALSAVQLSWLPETRGDSMEPFRQTWSLGVEWLFYLSWPVLLWALARRGVTARGLAGASWTAAVAVWVASLMVLPPEVVYFSPAARSGQILAGAGLALWFASAPPRASSRPAVGVSLYAAIASMSIFVLFGPGPLEGSGGVVVGSTLATVAAVLIIRHGYVATRGLVVRALSSPALAALGRVSYSLYLWHWIPLYVLDKDEMGLPVPVVAAVGVALTAVLTGLSYVLLERPFLGARTSALRDVGAAEAGQGRQQLAETPPDDDEAVLTRTDT